MYSQGSLNVLFGRKGCSRVALAPSTWTGRATPQFSILSEGEDHKIHVSLKILMVCNETFFLYFFMVSDMPTLWFCNICVMPICLEKYYGLAIGLECQI